ncbi:MAG: hypothetical protein HY287_04535 [Planctomycetes bacterium]|nr:hypothetical protein [Planctomycetota bacterium]MBI3833581.1 hypothetical protein [Planctomycetota bacterium]
MLDIRAFLLGSDPRYRERVSPRAILRIALISSFLFAVFASLYAYSPGWGRAYRWYFRGVNNVAFSQFWIWPRASIEFFDLNSPTLFADLRHAGLPENFPVREADGVKDTLMLCKNSDDTHRRLGQLRTSSKIIGYWPTVMVMALAVATPWAWKRKRWVILWCFAAVHFLIVARLTLFALKGAFAVPTKALRVMAPSLFWSNTLQRLEEVVNDDPTFNFISAFVIWAVVLIVLEIWRSRRESRASRQQTQSPKDRRPDRTPSRSRIVR